MIEKKTTKDIREMDLSEGCPMIEGLPNTIDPTRYFDYIKEQNYKVWVSMESLQQLLTIPPIQLLKKHKTDSYQQALSIELSEVGE